MRVLVTGIENSGTGVVAQILREAGAEVVHKAVPHVHDWEAARRELRDVDALVVVVRGLLANCRSMEERSGALAVNGHGAVTHREIASRWLADLLVPTWHATFVVTYESLFRPEEVKFLCETLGLDFDSVSTCVTPGFNERRYYPKALV